MPDSTVEFNSDEMTRVFLDAYAQLSVLVVDSAVDAVFEDGDR